LPFIIAGTLHVIVAGLIFQNCARLFTSLVQAQVKM
jgi:hypothetical protein